MSKIHLLGVGSMGTLIAHELVQAHPYIVPNFTLLFKNLVSYEAFKNQDSKLVLNKLDSTSSASSVDADYRIASGDKIQNLIVATKSYQTVEALHKYIDHITPETNILLVQNGMGMLDQLNEIYWPYPERRPVFYQAISTHGAYKSSPTVVNHVGLGKLDIARVSDGPTTDMGSPYSEARELLNREEAPEFIKLILATKSLNAHFLSYPQFVLKQVEKLVINSCINPLTALFDCLNGELLYSSSLIMKRIIREDVKILKAEFPLLGTMPETEAALDEDRLLQMVIQVCQTTANNSSSMREDLRLLKNTEIDWINGYIVGLGKKHEIPCTTNALMLLMVREKLAISRAAEKHSVNTIIRQLSDDLK